MRVSPTIYCLKAALNASFTPDPGVAELLSDEPDVRAEQLRFEGLLADMDVTDGAFRCRVCPGAFQIPNTLADDHDDHDRIRLALRAHVDSVAHRSFKAGRATQPLIIARQHPGKRSS